MSRVLVTGAAGFIGFHLCKRLLDEGQEVVGIDNINSYYDVNLKHARLHQLQSRECFRFAKMDIADCDSVVRLFEREKFEAVVNLAAQVGVRHSVKDPSAYATSNIVGFMNVLEGCRHGGVKHLVFASSSSVYGANTLMPFSIHHNVDHPVSLYAATKKSNELMAHAYAAMYNLPCTGLRFFTVYGPWGRPDMAIFTFTKAILEGKSIDVFNYGKMKRDFTYVDDVVEVVMRVLAHGPKANAEWSGDHPDPATSFAPYRNYNVGNSNPVDLKQFIEAIESASGKKAQINLLPMQPGDIPATFADVHDLERDFGFRPAMCLEEGVRNFVDWYRSYYHRSNGDDGERYRLG
jgi:UDP-glucuronate 4-epimerase